MLSKSIEADSSLHGTQVQLVDSTEALKLPASTSVTSNDLVPSSENEKRNGLDATSLAKWNKLAERGGIGKAVALEDCMANRKGDLMFLAGDEITILRALTEDIFLGFCEGVIGRFYRQHVRLPTGLAAATPLNGSTSSSADPLSTSSSANDSFSSLPLQASSTSNSIASKHAAEPLAAEDGPPHEAKPPHFGSSPEVERRENYDTTSFDNVRLSTANSRSDVPDSSQHIGRESSRSSIDDQQDQTTDNIRSSASSISSSWSHRSNLDNPSEGHLSTAQSVAVALRGFATGAKVLNNEDESEFGRRYHSRDSSLHGSEISWSSARESEVSEGSIRYPTTVSLIDRMKAMRMPAAFQSAGASPPAHEPPSVNVEQHERPVLANGEPSSQEVFVPSMAKAILLPMSPPARPEKNRLRSQPSEEIVQSPLSAETVAAAEKDDLGEVRGIPEHGTEPAQREVIAPPLTAEIRREEPETQKDAAADTLSVMTGESNPFEFGTGVSATTTPNENFVPPTELFGTELPSSLIAPAVAQIADHSATTEGGIGSTSLNPVQGHKAASSSLGVIRELANRFSTASDIMRKHHVNDVGEQSYFPVVADKPTPPAEEKPVDVFGTLAMAEPLFEHQYPEKDDGLENAEPESPNAAPAATLSNPVVLGNTISSGTEPTTPDEQEIKSRRHESKDEWNILDDYVAGFTSPGPHSPEAPQIPPKSISVLSDVTSTMNSKPVNETVPGLVKKKVSGILKIRTAISSPRAQQDENSPKAVRTPTDATFDYGSPEGSMSPDTKRFRAFAMHSASPTVTPTKSGPRVQPRSISSSFGSKSAEATKMVQDDTLHGQLTMDLTSARNPVPINFLLGQASGSPSLNSSPQNISPSTSNGTPQQYRSAASPSPAYGKHSPKAPSSPFFPSTSDKPRSRSFSAVEVPLPMHRSESSNSLQVAYAGILQNGQIPERQIKEEHEGKLRRSLSRSGTGKLSALRRKLSLKGGDLRPDLAAVHVANPPPLPDTPSMRSLKNGRGTPQAMTGSPSTEQAGTKKRAEGPASPSTVAALDRQPDSTATPGSPCDFPSVSRSKESPIGKAAIVKPLGTLPANVSSDVPPASPSAPVYDQWGFLASHSPVPPLFATMRTPDKEVSKLEQTLLTLTEQPPTASSSKKVKMLVENHLPPSVRARVWKWLLSAPSIPHQQYQEYIDSFDIPQLEIDPSLLRRFGDHRAFMHGFQAVQQMMFLYITRHQNAPPPPDTIWIASVFLTQSFHEADGYALYESFLERMKECWGNQQLRNWAQVLQEVIQAHDPILAKHLAVCPDLYHTLIRKWTLTMFAEAIPLPTCLRALDLIIVQGTSPILKLSAVIILLCSKRLQGLTNPSDFTTFLLQPPQEWLSPEIVFKNMSKIALPKRGFNLGKLGSPRM